jgi:hypothetical protein
MMAADRAWPSHGHLAEIDPASPVGQRWWHGRHSWTRPEHGGFDPRRYEVHPIPDPVAKSYVERMHYSGSYVAASRRYGMFLHTPDGPDLVGVAVFAVPAQARVLTNVFPDLEPYTQSLELGRFVLEGQPQHPHRPSTAMGRAPSNSALRAPIFASTTSASTVASSPGRCATGGACGVVLSPRSALPHPTAFPRS